MSSTEDCTDPLKEVINEAKDAYAKIQYLIDSFVPLSEDGTFTFPDGDTWYARSSVESKTKSSS